LKRKKISVVIVTLTRDLSAFSLGLQPSTLLKYRIVNKMIDGWLQKVSLFSYNYWLVMISVQRLYACCIYVRV
jgi:hypothetical protein